jgi:capsular polysaccharide transport system permease protein
MSVRPLPAYRPTSFLDALAVQGRVIGALVLRELHTRYGRENIGYLWMIGEPMLLASVIGALHAGSGHSYGGDIKPVPFAVLGYTLFMIFRGIVNRAEGGVEANAPLLYHKQVTVLDINLARGFLEFGSVILTLTMLMGLLILVGLAAPPARPLPLMISAILIWWYSIGHAFVISAISYENRTVGRFVHPYAYFMVGLSGAFVPLGWLPPTFRMWLSWIPLTHVFELARYGWFRTANLDYFSGEYLVGACLVLTWTGLVLMRRLRAHIHLT